MGIFGGLGMLFASVVIWRTTQSAAAGQLTRQGAMGIRTRATQASDAAWVAGHSAAMRVVQPLCLVGVALGLVLAVVGLVAPDSVWLTVTWVVSFGTLGVGLLYATRLANRAARAAA